jgi:hypothetical protein
MAEFLMQGGQISEKYARAGNARWTNAGQRQHFQQWGLVWLSFWLCDHEKAEHQGQGQQAQEFKRQWFWHYIIMVPL